MCGIAGVYCFGESRPSVDMVKHLLLENELRGKDSAGVAYFASDGRFLIRKAQGPAKEFVQSMASLWPEISRSRIILLHTRHATQGKPEFNENNHPVTGFGRVITHNGMVTNDDEVFEHYGQSERSAAVDSIAINLALFKEGRTGITRLAGSATFAAWDHEDRENLLLARVGHNDLYLYRPQEDMLVWSSAVAATRHLVRQRLGGLGFATMGVLPENYGLYLSRAGGETFKVTRSPIAHKRSTSTTYPSKGQSASSHLTGTPKGTSSKGSAGPGSTRKGATNILVAPYPWSVLRDKYAPIFDQVEIPSPYGSPSFLKMKAENTTGPVVMETPYGRWGFGDGMKLYFQPHRRVKTWIEKNYVPWWDEKEMLKEDVPTGFLDRELVLERVSFTDTNLPGVYARRDVFLCPWCGWSDAKWTWQSKNGCSFCGIIPRAIPEGVY